MPYVRAMRRQDKARSGICLGGLGTGFFELRADGIFYNWNIFNNYPYGTGAPFNMPHDSMLFFVLRYEVQGQQPQMKILQIDEGYRVAAIPDHYYAFPWLTGVDEVRYRAVFPFVNMKFSDAQMPLDVEMEAFSPFIPHDVMNSALPAAIFRFRIRSRSRKPVHVMLMASMHNGVGYDVQDKFHVIGVQQRGAYKLCEMTEDGMDTAHSSYGSQALASLASDSTHYLGWEAPHPYYEIAIRSRQLPNVDDTEGRNKIDPKTGKLRAMYQAYSTLAVSRQLSTGKGFDHTFVVAWHFPNLYNPDKTRIEGHYYSNFFGNAGEVASYVIDNLPALHRRSRQFVDDYYDSSAPAFVLDQVNSHLNTFVTNSWLTKDMNFGIQEGLSPHRAYGPLATVDVSMYGAMSVSALFPELHKSMMRAHRRLQAPSGEVGHGINRDFQKSDVHEAVKGRLDLPSQYTLLALRGFFWTGDRTYLEEMWPSVKAALDYVLRERDPNGDFLPDVSGAMCTYDNFVMHGASAYVCSLWLAALMQAVAAARAVGDDAAVARYSDVLQKARAAFDAKLWNGRYYRLYNDEGGQHGGVDEGCLTDQLIGQWANHLVGLGDLVDRSRIRKALKFICKVSRQPWGLVNCRWPGDKFLHDVPPECWHDQANTCWSGVELAFASFLLYEGMDREALEVIRNVDDRYRKAGMYWDHIEFGGHYYRPMSAWAIINAMLGLTINDGCYSFSPRLPGRNLRLFFSFGAGTAHYIRKAGQGAERIALAVRTGDFAARELTFALLKRRPSALRLSLDGRALPEDSWRAEFLPGAVRLRTDPSLVVRQGQRLELLVK